MSDKMANAPIFFMAAQIKFNPILDIETAVKDLQSAWRKSFPDFSFQAINQLQLNLNPNEDSKIKQSNVQRWHFKDVTGTSALVLTPELLFLQTTEYDTSEPFIATLLNALADVHKTVSLSYIDAVSFRSLDAVVPDQHRAPDFFLKPSLLGLYPVLEGTLKHSICELLIQQDPIQLISRCALLNGAIGIPADMFPFSLNMPPKIKSINGIHAILDNDAIYAERFNFDIEEAAKRLKLVKSAISDAFHKAVTPKAIAFWKTREHENVD